MYIGRFVVWIRLCGILERATETVLRTNLSRSESQALAVYDLKLPIESIRWEIPCIFFWCSSRLSFRVNPREDLSQVDDEQGYLHLSRW